MDAEGGGPESRLRVQHPEPAVRLNRSDADSFDYEAFYRPKVTKMDKFKTQLRRISASSGRMTNRKDKSQRKALTMTALELQTAPPPPYEHAIKKKTWQFRAKP